MGQRNGQLGKAMATPFDLVIVGGGIVGACVARDAARRGISTLLLEQGDLASGTSSRSSKMVHGGLRYLEQYKFGLVFESVNERQVLMDIAPHLVRPLPFVFPLFEGGKNPLLIAAGMWLYDALSLFRSPHIHKRIAVGKVASVEPALRTDALKGAELYYDCATDDSRLTLEIALSAMQAGATVVTWCEVTGFPKDADGRIVGVQVRDRVGNTNFQVSSKAVVNATGPWTDRVRALGQDAPPPRLLRLTKGTHIVVDLDRLPLQHAVVMANPDDGRVLFGVPWGNRAYVGTTDTDWEGDPARIAATRADVDYLLRSTNAYFPHQKLSADDVIATWSGLRPLIYEEGKTESQVSREHKVEMGSDGMVTIAGGKLTTCRLMAADVVEVALRDVKASGWPPDGLRDPETGTNALPGAVGWPEDGDEDRMARDVVTAGAGHLATETARHLVGIYGTLAQDIGLLVARKPTLAAPLLPGHPDILAQVEWASTREMASTLCDVLMRRLSFFLKDRDQGLGAAAPVAAHLAALQGWDGDRIEREIAGYRAEVDLSRAWRHEGSTP